MHLFFFVLFECVCTTMELDSLCRKSLCLCAEGFSCWISGLDKIKKKHNPMVENLSAQRHEGFRHRIWSPTQYGILCPFWEPLVFSMTGFWVVDLNVAWYGTFTEYIFMRICAVEWIHSKPLTQDNSNHEIRKKITEALAMADEYISWKEIQD